MANITSTGMRVGDGTAASYTLDVAGSINTASQFVANVDATNTNPLSLANNAASGSLLQILQTGTAGGWLNNCVAGDTSIRSFGKLLLAAGSTSGTGILNASIILGNSNYCVGIGSNVNPSSTLDVVGTTRLTTASSLASTAPDGGANHGLMLVSTKAPDSGKTAYSMALGVDSGTGYGYINAAGNTALQPILLQSRGGGVGIGRTTAPNYSLDVYGGSANFSFNGTYGTVFVGSSDGLLIQGYSSGASYIRADCNAANGISTNALFLGTGGCNVVDITRTDVQCHPTNALYVRNDKGAGNFVVEGTSYLNNISNTNVYATGGLFSGTTAGRLVMIGVQSGCYIEAGLDSTTGSAVPLYFTDMNNANQWMCIGSTGNVGINNNSPVGRFHVKTSGNVNASFTGWDSTWMVVTPVANATTAKNTPGLGLGYSAATDAGYVTSLAPNDSWKNLNLDASTINISPHGGTIQLYGMTRMNGTSTIFGSNYIANGTVPAVAGPYTMNGTWLCHMHAQSTSNAASVMLLVYGADGGSISHVSSIVCGGALTVALTSATTSNYYIALQNSTGTTQWIRWSFLFVTGTGF
jgi:hypothetical protein